MTNTSTSILNSSEGNTYRQIQASRQQQQIWMLNQLYPDNPAYNLSAAFRIKGKLNIEALNKSYFEAVNSYEIFHTSFQMDRGELKQIVTGIENIAILNEEFGAENNTRREESINQYILERVSAPFDHEKAPLIKAFLLHITNDDHLFLLVSHQIVADYASMNYLLQYISEQYSIFSNGLTVTDPLKPKQYSDYVNYQNQQIDEGSYAEKLNYWKNTVLNPNGFLDIPVSCTRPSIQTFEGKKHEYNFPENLSDSINKLAREMGISVEAVFLGLFQILLFRYTGNGGFSIGFPFLNRNTDKFNDLLGPLENILPFTSNISDSLALRNALLRTQKALQEASNHQDVTFDSIVEIIKPLHDPGYNPIYQVGFRFFKSPRLVLNNLEIIQHDCFNKTSFIDLFFNIIDDKGKYKLRIVYNPGLFDASAVAAFVEQYEVLLANALESKETPISLLNLLPEADKHKQLIDWNNTKRPFPKHRKIHEFFEYQASLNPDSIAVEFEKNKLTYRELDQRANQLAHFLQKYKVAPNVLVGVCLERSCEMMIALLGVLKAGGGYIPMDPEYPKDRIAYIAENSNAPVLITQQSLLSFLPETDASTVCIDRDWQEIETYPVDKFPDNAEPDNVAYVIYTSGSTGRPKGVQIPHGAVSNLMASMAKEPGMNKNDVLVCVTTYSFDLSVPDLYLPLYTGARTVFVKREIAADGPQLAKILKETKATFMQATPSTWTLLLDSGWEGSKELTALCGGEAWPANLAGILVPRVKALWNMYGPTETTVWSTCYHISNPDSPVLIGKPIDNTSVYVLDKNLQLVPIGVPGELYIGGHGVSLGYLGRPELNKSSFIENPFNIDGHPRIYKTGDSVRYRPDGNLEYLNRLDNQVKIRGLRIELGEIESVLLKFPNIKQGVVIVREDNPDDKRLVGYFVASDGNKISEKELREFLKSTLASYMVPHHIVQLDELPRTPNGKVDRKALPVPQQIIADEKQPYKDPTHLKKLPMDDWFYKPVWKPIQLESNAELPQAATCLLFLDEDGIGEELAGYLRKKEYDVITVRLSDSYYKFNESEYCINPEQGLSGYVSLAADLAANGRFPNKIAHLWMLTGQETFRPGSSFFHRNLECGFYSILYLIQALNKQGLTNRSQLLVALNGSQKVYSEYIPYPEKVCVLGPCMVMTREFPQMKTSVVDFDYPAKKPQILLHPRTFISKRMRKRYAKLLEKELLVPSENDIIAYRKGRRFVKQYEQVALPSSSSNLLRKGGVYLIAGGLGKKGKQIAHYLAKNIQARLIIVDRKQLPDKKDWNNFLSGTDKEQSIANDIKTLRELETHGQEVIFYSADIADAGQMAILLEDVKRRFGAVNGVIHAASMDTSDPIYMQDNNKVERCFAARVKGTLALDQLFQKLELDMFILFSSSDIVTAGTGKAGVVAAGAFMDAYTENCAANNKRKTICLVWGYWDHSEVQTGTGLGDATDPSGTVLTDNERLLNYISMQGLKPEECFQVFEKSLAGQSGVLVVSPINLFDYASEIELRCSGTYGDELAEPRDDIERTLVDYWKEIIGIRHLGVRQNFFDVGGHSLTAVRLFAKIQQKYNVQWPLAVLFEAPTIEACARLIRNEIQGKRQNKDGADSQEFRFLVKMHESTGNDTVPIYIAAGGFGNVLNLRHLAQLIGNQRPVYGIQAKGLLGDDLPHETFESTACDYLKEIRKVQPNGPYILAGFCSGGEIAYEMAQQLINDGEDVSHVIMLDAIASDWREKLTRKDKIAFHIMNFKRAGIKYPFIWFVNRVKWELKKLREKFGLNKEETGPAVFRGRAIFDATLRAEDRYKPKPYAGKVTLFRPKLDQFVFLDGGRVINKKREFVRPDNGWSPHIKQLDIQEIAVEPGDHDGFVLEPAVRDLYFKLKTVLESK
ncbi:MAG: amino acid adenylation domain-containing protein [Spirochaetota bacterium]